MSKLPINKIVTCPKTGNTTDPDCYCLTCKYYRGDSFDSIICKHGEMLVDKLEEYLKKYDAGVIFNEDNAYLLEDQCLGFKITKDNFESLSLLVKEDIKANDFIKSSDEEKVMKYKKIFLDFFKNFDKEKCKEVNVTDISYKNLRLFEIDGELGAFNYKYNWLLETDADIKMVAEDKHSVLYLLEEDELVGILMPIRFDEKKEEEILKNISNFDI